MINLTLSYAMARLAVDQPLLMAVLFTRSSMDSQDWAKYIEATDGLSKLWLLIQWRLQWLNEPRFTLPAAVYDEVYDTELAHLHQLLMDLGPWWKGQDKQVFGAGEK